VVAAVWGGKKKHAVGAAAAGLLVCLPAVMTLWVNLSGLEGFKWLGIVQIPVLENFDKADSLFDGLTMASARWEIRCKVWAVITGGIFQILDHMNISREMFAPAGMGALYVISLPLMLLGGFYLLHCVLEGKYSSRERFVGRMFVLVVSLITLAALIVYGSVGALDLDGCTSVFDYSSLLLFDALLMAVGLCRMENKSCAGISVLCALMCACTVMLGVYLFGAAYSENSNTYFTGFNEASIRAAEIQEETDAKVNVTCTVYPHITPTDAAEMMYLYAVNADIQNASEGYGTEYEVIYAPGIAEPDFAQIYMVSQEDVTEWDLTGFNYEEYGDYVLLSPLES